MTPEDMEKSLGGLTSKVKHMEDAQIVQGVLERRIEDQIQGLTAALEFTERRTREALEVADRVAHGADALLKVAAGHEQRLAAAEERLSSAEDRLQGVEERVARLESGMISLFERMDRFIRGLESNGHKQGNP